MEEVHHAGRCSPQTLGRNGSDPIFWLKSSTFFQTRFGQATKVTQPSCARQHPTVGHDPTIVPMPNTGLNWLGRTGEALHRYGEGIIDGS